MWTGVRAPILEWPPPSTLAAALLENTIRTLLEAPESGEGAPTLAHIEHLLTSGYARAMELPGADRQELSGLRDLCLSRAGDGGSTRVDTAHLVRG